MKPKTLNIILLLSSLIAITLLYSEICGTTFFFKHKLNSYALGVGLLIPFSLLFLGYVQLRNIEIYLIWLLLSIGMLLFYFQFKDLENLQMKRGSALNSFKSLLVFLVLFQLCRLLILKITGREYRTPSIAGQPDIFENQKAELPDFIMFGILFFAIIIAQEI